MKDITIQRTNGTHPDFLALVTLLDASLAESDGDLHDFYNQYNGLENIKNVIVAFSGTTPVGCGALKFFSDDCAEIKRMFTSAMHRGNGIGSLILEQLETWAFDLGFTCCILETGKRQPDAIALYRKNGYTEIPQYPPYIDMENSVCFKKKLS